MEEANNDIIWLTRSTSLIFGTNCIRCLHTLEYDDWLSYMRWMLLVLCCFIYCFGLSYYSIKQSFVKTNYILKKDELLRQPVDELAGNIYAIVGLYCVSSKFGGHHTLHSSVTVSTRVLDRAECHSVLTLLNDLVKEPSIDVDFKFTYRLRVDVLCSLGMVFFSGLVAISYFTMHVFGQILDGNTLVWNAMIGGYLKNDRYEKVVELYRKMRTNNGVEVDSCTCTFALKACARLLDFESGMEIVRIARENGFEKDRFFGSSAISFLVKFGKVDEARDVFEELFHRDVVCWNSMIKGYVQVGSFDIAFEMFFQMQGCGIRPTPITMAGLIQACIGIGSLRLGKCIHRCLNGFGMCCDILVGTSLIDMYGKMGDVESARQVFDRMTARNLISWNSMISGYVQNGLVFKAFDLFGVLVLSGGGFDSGTMASLLQGCAQLSSVDNGKVLHCCVLRRRLESNVIVSTAIVDLYAKSGAVKLARSVFSAMKEKNVISWTAMLMGLAQNGHAEEAFKIFCQMQEEGVDANVFTLVSLIHACAHVGSLKKGQSIHAYLIRHVFSLDEIVRTALIDMYSKCGKIESCKKVFENVSMSRDVVLWNSMITSYGMHGHGHLAVGLYSHMNKKGIRPNQTSFVSLLSACSHSGLVDEGINLFHIMSRDHGIMPNEKHYACLVDLLGRAGRLDEAEALIEHMPFEPSSAVLEALLSGCKTHKNINIGIKTADRLLILDAMNLGIYVVLSNMYAEGRRWSEVDYVRGLMRKRGLRKTPGYSLTEVANVVHAFFAGDDSHPFREEIYKMLESINMQIEASGYIPDTSCVLRDVDE
ncbi:hypothetical protein IFM89_028221 [Coptis chinensis]|uniref:Pentatricopeptide repeat-containing protein n=1 Tax=Coptis chinensis TaxID=261450 RepID=A0A835IRR7_9MAGN|nr:hypothetical protein IFM89_028221 [Coptis chinensis]